MVSTATAPMRFLFIDAHNLVHLIIRSMQKFSDDEIGRISETYYNWRNPDGDYADILGFCNSALLERVRELDYVPIPVRYVGLPND